ncbi:MAG: hypothetical protein UZ07_CHB004000312 [Chlorobi bacterium OLB7]|nr:MAG: hypothetical protein UZ07_CHB004000312 [Chlorobi bacterium OLB7]
MSNIISVIFNSLSGTRSPSLLAPFAALMLASLGLQFLPLTGELHYEFSGAMALVASLVVGLATLWRGASWCALPSAGVVDEAAARDHRRQIATDFRHDLAPRNRSLHPSIDLCRLCVRVSATGCGIADGLLWYLLLVPASAWISSVLALLAGMTFCRRWVQLCGFLGLWSLTLFRGGHEAYHGPHIFMYAWQIGFFPGGSWDPELPITGRLLLYRIAHVAVAAALLLVVQELQGLRLGVQRGIVRKGGVLLAGALSVAAVAAIPFRSDLGLSRTDGWVRMNLGDTLRTRHATIYFNAFSTDSLDRWRAANLADFYLEEHARTLGIRAEEIEPVTLYLFASPDEQKMFVGTSSASFTKPWKRELYQTFDRIEGALRHELAHLVAARYGALLGISLNQGLLEGTAVALDDAWGNRTLFQYARAIGDLRLAPPAATVMTTSGFSSQKASLGYVVAGAFCKWLIQSYGAERFRQAYGWGDFLEAYGKPLDSLAAEYERYVAAMPAMPETDRPAMRYLFGGGSFFSQHCLRRIATLNGAGFRALAEGRWGKALEAFGESEREGTSYGARGGIIRALYGQRQWRTLIDSCAAWDRHDTANYPLLPFLIERGDACWWLGDTATARRLYDSAMAMDISVPLRYRAALRAHFLENGEAGKPMLEYFTAQWTAAERLSFLHRLRESGKGDVVVELMETMLTANFFPKSTAARLQGLLRSIESDSASRGTGPASVQAIAWLTAYQLRDLFSFVRAPLPTPQAEWDTPFFEARRQEQRRLLEYLEKREKGR